MDCGSRDREIVSYAKDLGIDVIVTDHHHVPEDMPDDAVAFLNPNRPDCSYPEKRLSGAGVALSLYRHSRVRYFLQKKQKNIYVKVWILQHLEPLQIVWNSNEKIESLFGSDSSNSSVLEVEEFEK